MTIKTSQLDWLRNDYITDITIGGITYPTAEHAYQASKTNNREVKQKIAAADITEARRLGKSIDLDGFWDDYKYSKMLFIIRQKFMQNDTLADRLMKLGNDDIEADMRDEFWGTGRSNFGENNLGNILAAVRDEIQDINGWTDEDEAKKEPSQEDISTTIKYCLEYVSEEDFTNLMLKLYNEVSEYRHLIPVQIERVLDEINDYAKQNLHTDDEDDSWDEEEIEDDEDDLD